MQRQLVFHQFGRGRMADGDEKAVARHIGGGTGQHVAGAHAGDTQRGFGAQNLDHVMVPQHADLRVLEQAVLQDLFGAKAVAAVDDGDFGGEFGQEQRFFHRRIAAADHHDLATAIKEAVAGGAGRDAKAFELLFGRQPQPFRLRAGGKDDGIGGKGGAAIRLRGERASGQIKCGDNVRNHLGPHRPGVIFHPDHQIGALHFAVARPVLDLGGDGQLPAGLHALHQDRVQHGAGRIDRSGIAGGAGADDQNP